MKLVYQDVPTPEMKDDEVLVRVQSVGICGSDVHGMDGSTGRRLPPIIMGHEASGIIEACGKDVQGWQPGDIFTSLVTGTATHIGLVSDRPGRRGPLIIHNIGAGAREEDALLDWPITGRFRWSVD